MSPLLTPYILPAALLVTRVTNWPGRIIEVVQVTKMTQTSFFSDKKWLDTGTSTFHGEMQLIIHGL